MSVGAADLVGNHGVDQPANYNLNASTTLGADVAGQPLNQKFGKKASVEDHYVGYSSMYNGLQLTLKHMMAHGVRFQVAYTWSKAMTDVTGLGFDNGFHHQLSIGGHHRDR